MTFAYVLPPEYHFFKRADRFLFIDPRNFIWFATDKLGKLVVDCIASDANFDAIIDEILKSVDGAERSAAAIYVEKVIQGLVDIGFLHRGKYAARTDLPVDAMSRPVVMYLHLSNGCNLRCSYCYNQEHRYQLGLSRKAAVDEVARRTINKSDYYRLIDRAAELGFKEVKLTGGEALLNKDALSIARRAMDKGIHVNLLTNGTLVTTPDFAKKIVNSVNVVSISLDSKKANLHDFARGLGTHHKVLKAIELLREEGLKELHINGVITPTTIDSAEELLAYAWDQLGAKAVTLSGSALQVNDPRGVWGAASQNLSVEQYTALDDHVYKFYRAREIRRTAPAYRNHCGVGNGIISIDSNGDVYPCQTLHEKHFWSGNVFDTDLLEILQDSSVIRESKSLTVDSIEECNVCPVRYICHSGCRSEAYTWEGSIAKRNAVLCPSFFKKALNQLWDSVDL